MKPSKTKYNEQCINKVACINEVFLGDQICAPSVGLDLNCNQGWTTQTNLISTEGQHSWNAISTKGHRDHYKYLTSLCASNLLNHVTDPLNPEMPLSLNSIIILHYVTLTRSVVGTAISQMICPTVQISSWKYLNRHVAHEQLTESKAHMTEYNSG